MTLLLKADTHRRLLDFLQMLLLVKLFHAELSHKTNSVSVKGKPPPDRVVGRRSHHVQVVVGAAVEGGILVEDKIAAASFQLDLLRFEVILKIIRLCLKQRNNRILEKYRQTHHTT